MKNKKLLSLLILSTALVIGGCNNNSSSASDNSSNTNTSDTTSNSSTTVEDSSSSSSSSEEESSSQAPIESVIRVEADSNKVTYECKDKAFTNEVVEIKITAKDGYMISSVTCNGKQCSGSNGVYKFVMPNTSALIEITAVLVETGDYYISDENGNAVANLTQAENGLFVAKDVSFNTDTAVQYNIKGNVLTVSEINIEKTFANLDVKRTGRGGFMIGGNATYDFYYDPANVTYPCYIVRTKVNSLPTSASDVYDLFDGSVRSESTVNPVNLNHVEYKSTTANEDYSWDLYSDNSSLATVKNLLGKDVARVYKAQKDNLYVVVDDYTEANYGSKSNYVERGDTTPFAGKYDIVDSAESGKGKYQRTAEEVEIDANKPSHTVESIYFDTYEAYTNSHVNNVMSDVEVKDGCFDPATMLPTTNGQRVKSELVGDNGDFKVTVNYYVMWENSSGLSLTSAYITYDFEVLFDKAGSIKEGSYTERTYTSSYFDFTSKTFKTNPFDSNTTTSEFVFKYGYGNKIDGQPNFDTTPYFISSISDINYVGKEGNSFKVSVSEELKSLETKNGNDWGLSYSYLPATALDSWQYGISKSSNRTVINTKRVSTPYEFLAIGFGTSTMTIDNHTANGADVKESFDITVANEPFIKSAFMNTTTCDQAYKHETIYANKGEINTGKSYTVQMNASTKANNYISSNMKLHFSFKSAAFVKNDGSRVNVDNPENYIKIPYDDETGLLTFDVKKTVLPSDVKYLDVVISIDSDFTSEELWQNSEIQLIIKPGEEVLESIVGSWSAANSQFADTVTFTDVDSTTYSGYKTGVIKYYNDSTSSFDTYEFSYTYDSKKGNIIMKLDSINNKAINSSQYSFKACLFPDNQLGIYLAYSVQSDDSFEVTVTEIMGTSTDDGEGYVEYSYETYNKD